MNAAADQHVVRHLRAQVALTPDRPALTIRRMNPRITATQTSDRPRACCPKAIPANPRVARKLKTTSEYSLVRDRPLPTTAGIFGSDGFVFAAGGSTTGVGISGYRSTLTTMTDTLSEPPRRFAR